MNRIETTTQQLSSTPRRQEETKSNSPRIDPLVSGIYQKSQVEAMNWVRQLPRRPVFAIDTDVGNDTDDLLSHILSAIGFGDKIRLITTTLYNALEKARITTLALRFLGKEIPVCAGAGVDKARTEEEMEKSWAELLPNWPLKIFKIPGFTNEVSKFQGAAYRAHFKDFDDIKVSPIPADKALLKLTRDEGKNLIVIAEAPLNNLAKVQSQDPKWMERINRVVMMGGWFEDEKGDILRLGYNTAVNLQASKTFLQQDKLNVLLVTSELAKSFVIRDQERTVFALSKHKTKLGNAISDDMQNYWEKRVPAKKGDLSLADVLTAHLAYHPEDITETNPVQIKFNEDLMDINMMDPRMKDVVRITKKKESNIHVVTELKDAKGLRRDLVVRIAKELFYPDVSEINLHEHLFSDKPPEEIADELNRLGDRHH